MLVKSKCTPFSILQAKIGIFLLLAAFFFSDWKFPIGGISFSDIFALCLIIVLFNYLFSLSKFQILSILGLTLLVLLNLLGQYILNPNLGLSHYYVYIAKALTYSTSLCLIYNAIKKNSLEKVFFKCFIRFTLFWCWIAIIIYIIQVLNLGIPYKILWFFTRTDDASFIFRGSSLIRMRGLNSEPSYFGGVLALALTINYFNSFEYRTGIYYELLILGCSFLSFSFSVVPIVLFMKLLDIVNTHGIFFIKKKWAIYMIFAILTVLGLFFDKIFVAFISRFYDIVSGKDTSAISRLFGSWKYVNNLFIGNGVGNTPAIWNNFAYILSDLGLIPFLFSILSSLILCKRNLFFGIFLIMVSFQKGGYFSFYYWILIFMLIVFSSNLDVEM